LERAKASLDEQERAIADFKRKFIGELPSQMDANLQTLNRLEREQTTLSESIRHRLDRKTALDKMISTYESIGLASVESPREAIMNQDVVADLRGKGRAGSSRQADSLGLRLKELERNLVSMSAEYKDSYPDVIALKKEIAQIKSQIMDKQRLHQPDIPEEAEVGSTKPTLDRKSAISQPPVDAYLHELKRERDETEIGLNSLKEQEKRLAEQIRLYQSRVERTPEREQELIVLQRDYENTKRNYQALLDKQLNAKISEDLERKQKAGKFRIVDPAHLPVQPEYPDPARFLLAGLIFGCLGGYGAAFALEMLKKGFTRAEEAESLLGLPVLASIPNFMAGFAVEYAKNRSFNSTSIQPVKVAIGSNRPALPYDSKMTANKRKGLIPWVWRKNLDDDVAYRQASVSGAIRDELNIIIKWKPKSLAAEQFRVAATRLVLSSSGQENTVVVVTSAVSGEGKTTTVSNLGYVLADDLGKSTLLIDCDFKRPMLHHYNNVPSKPGLVEAIYGDAQLEDCLHHVEGSSLSILPCGRRDHRLVDLANIPQINSFISKLKKQFEFIIMDAPPILPLADMNLLALMADMLLVVIRVNTTPQDVVQSAIKNLKRPARAGIILTACDNEPVSAYLREHYGPQLGAYHS
jgi:polysaccharide biosynthesis transport protein